MGNITWITSTVSREKNTVTVMEFFNENSWSAINTENDSTQQRNENNWFLENSWSANTEVKEEEAGTTGDDQDVNTASQSSGSKKDWFTENSWSREKSKKRESDWFRQNKWPATNTSEETSEDEETPEPEDTLEPEKTLNEFVSFLETLYLKVKKQKTKNLNQKVKKSEIVFIVFFIIINYLCLYNNYKNKPLLSHQ